MTEYDRNTFHHDPSDYWEGRNGRRKQQLEDEVRYLSYSITLKVKDLDRTRELHQEKVRELGRLTGNNLDELKGEK